MTFAEIMTIKAAAERLANNRYSDPFLRMKDGELVGNGFLDLMQMRVPERVELRAHGSFMDPSWGIGSSFIELYW